MSSANDNPLTPPMHSIPGEVLFDTLDSATVPRFRFAVARLNPDESVEVRESIPVPEPQKQFPDVGEIYVENVIQTYQVKIPYTDLNGERKMRTDHRTRTVPVQRVRPKPGFEDKWIKKTYTVSVPYTEMVGDTTIRRARLETRTRMAHVDEPDPKYVPKEVLTNYAFDKLRYFSTAGKPLTNQKAKNALKKPIPVLLVNNIDFITPYFESMLNPNSLLLVCSDINKSYWDTQNP